MSSDQPEFSPDGAWRQAVKHWIDVAICILCLPLVLPVMVICAVAIYLDSGRPIFFVQERIGKDGHLFRMYKFRTMQANFDTTLHRDFMKAFVRGEIGDDESGDVPLNGARAAPEFGAVPVGSESASEEEDRRSDLVGKHPLKSEDDLDTAMKIFKPIQASQITRVGRLLRKTSLDELPQIINVFKGEMSLVGPRPNVPWEVDEYRLWHSERLEVLPGITGLAQVQGRSSIPFSRIVKYDIQYIGKQGLGEDLMILLRTVLAVFTRKGSK